MTPASPPPLGLRILRVITRLNVGGPARQAVSLTRLLGEPPFRSLLVAGDVSKDEGDWTSLAQALGESFHRIPEIRAGFSPIRSLRALRLLDSILLRFQPHVVHTHESHAGVLGRIAALRRRVPVIVHTHHGHVLNGYFSRPMTSAIVRVERFLARRTAALVVPADEVATELVARGIADRSRFRVVAPGVDVESMLRGPSAPDADARRRLGIQPDRRVAGFVGRLAEVKEPLVAVEAAQRLAKRIPRFLFLVAGDGPMRSALEAAVRRSLPPEAVLLLGFRDDVATIFRALDVLLIASRSEGLPTALIEAMACGVPAVATAVGGIPGLIRDGVSGLLARCGSPDELTSAAASILLDDERRAAMSLAARESIRSAGFDPTRMARELASLYVDLLDESGALPEGVRESSPS